MNKLTRNKRILAIAIALGILAFSMVGSLVSRDRQIARLSKDLGEDYLSQLLSGGVEETVLQGSDENQRILVVPIYGVIGPTTVSAFGGISGYNHELILESIETAKTDPTVVGVLLDIDTGGGTVYHSEQVHSALRTLKEETDLPVYTSMGTVAASGGYYIGSIADKIYAANETITGSIGVISQYMNYEELANKIGIKYETFKSGPRKDSGSPVREMTDEERATNQQMITEMYERFIQVVMEGRSDVLTEDELRTLADGRIYTGRQAVTNGLIDEIGYFGDAIDGMAEELGVEDPEVYTMTNSGGVLDYLGGLGYKYRGITDLDLFLELEKNHQAPTMYYIYGGH